MPFPQLRNKFLRIWNIPKYMVWSYNQESFSKYQSKNKSSFPFHRMQAVILPWIWETLIELNCHRGFPEQLSCGTLNVSLGAYVRYYWCSGNWRMVSWAFHLSKIPVYNVYHCILICFGSQCIWFHLNQRESCPQS